MKKTLLLSLFILQLNACTLLDISSKQYKNFSNFSHQYNNPDHIQKENEPLIISEIKKIVPKIQKMNALDQISAKQSRLFLDFANLNAAYSEYLTQKHCLNLAEQYSSNAEISYLRMLKDEPDNTDYLYNISLFYARSSLNINDKDIETRINLLEKSKKYAEQLYQIEPENQQYKYHYFSVLSELLSALDKKELSLDQQKDFMHLLKPFLFELIRDNEIEYDSGNFFILVNHYYQYLVRLNPQQANQWLKQNQNKILNYYFKHQDSNTQRNNTLSAQLYALFDQPEKSIEYLKLLKIAEQDNYEPNDILNEKLFEKIRRLESFQTWFKQYSQEYKIYQDSHPKLCNSFQTDEHLKIANLASQMQNRTLLESTNQSSNISPSSKLEAHLEK